MNVTYLDSFAVEHIHKENKTLIGNKNIIKTIYSKEAYESILSECLCVGFIVFMLEGQGLLDYTKVFFLQTNIKTWQNNTEIFSMI